MFKLISILINPLIILLVFSCGGANGLTPDTNGSTRVLGIEFGSNVPSLIAFSRGFETQAGPAKDIFVMFPDGTHEKRMTNQPGDDDLPSFSPDGLFIACAANSLETGWGNRDIVILRNPSKRFKLSEANWEFNTVGLDWGPDYIVAGRHNTLIGAPFDVINLGRIDIDGNWLDPLTTGFSAAYDPCISRDGSKLAYCSRPGCPGEADPGCMGSVQLFILENGASEAVQITEFGGTPEEPINLFEPQFDFAGKRIVFQTNYWSDDWEIGVLYVDGTHDGELFRLTNNPTDDVEPCFDESGTWIAFASNRDGNFEIYKIPINGTTPGTPVRLTNTPEDESNPDWSKNY